MVPVVILVCSGCVGSQLKQCIWGGGGEGVSCVVCMSVQMQVNDGYAYVLKTRFDNPDVSIHKHCMNELSFTCIETHMQP